VEIGWCVRGRGALWCWEGEGGGEDGREEDVRSGEGFEGMHGLLELVVSSCGLRKQGLWQMSTIELEKTLADTAALLWLRARFGRISANRVY